MFKLDPKGWNAVDVTPFLGAQPEFLDGELNVSLYLLVHIHLMSTLVCSSRYSPWYH